MEKIVLRIFLMTSITFLTGCEWWKKKKVNNNENKAVVVNDFNNQINDTSNCIEIDFNDGNNTSYQIVTGKSIFADDEMITTETTEIENPKQDVNKESIEVDLLVDTPLTDNQKEIMIERDKVHLGTILFDFDKYEYVKSDYENNLKCTIHNIQSILVSNPNAKIIIEGHACNSCGSERYNQELSNNRALTVRDRICTQTTIDPNNVSVFGCGTSHLIVHGGRAEQAPNRRVEIFIIN